ncbi:heme-binding NEAT domain protein, partial [Paenibacillus cellulosilyticus]
IRLAFNRTIDHAALEALVTSAEAKVKAAVVGEEEGQYPEAAKTALTEAVAAAKVKGSWLSTQALVDEAASDLTSAIAAFDAAKIGTESNTVTLLVLHATDDYKLSSMSNYFLAPYTLTNESGTDYVSFTIKDSSIVTSLKTEQDGQLVEAVKVSEDTTADTRVVKFPVADLSAVLNAQVHISTVANGNPYEMDYSIRLAFNRTIDHAALEALVASAETKLTNAVVGTEAGQYPEAAKTALTEAVAAAKVKGSWLSTQALVDEAVSDLTSAIATFEAAVIASSGSGSGSGTTPVTSTVPDGKYSINFTIKKQGTNEASVMNGYVVHPGTLNVSGGVYKVTLRLTQSNEITGFTVGGVTPTTISSNTSKNTRDVQFTVSDLTTTLSGWVKIDWPAFNYHEDYNVQIELGNYYTYSEPGYTASPSIPSTSSSNTSDDEDTAAEETDSGEASGETTTDGGTSTTTPAVTFSDVNNHWAADSVQRAVQLGIVNGYSDGSFKPNGDITRAEFTAIISRALQLKTPDQSVSFNDLSTVPAWAKPFLEQAVAAGIISGYEDNTFRPFGNITRTEMTVMVVKALGLPLESASSLTFADAAGVPEYAKAYVATAVKYGLIQGKQNNQFDPLGKATRAEALVIVLRVLDYAAAQAEEQEAAANETA